MFIEEEAGLISVRHATPVDQAVLANYLNYISARPSTTEHEGARLTGSTTEKIAVIFTEINIFLFSRLSLLGPTQFPVQWNPGPWSP
jgi:hypothetical protein